MKNSEKTFMQAELLTNVLQNFRINSHDCENDRKTRKKQCILTKSVLQFIYINGMKCSEQNILYKYF